MTINNTPKQGEVWLFDPDPVIGSEIGKKIRPCIVISCNFFNNGWSGLIIIVPITSKNKGIFSHIKIDPPSGGLATTSFVVCEQIRTISKERLVKKLGTVRSKSTLQAIHQWILDLIILEI